jgi:hypothetical protein
MEATTIPSETKAWPERFSRQEAAQYLRAAHGVRIGWQHLAKLALHGTGPRFRKDGRFAIYDRLELDAWANGRVSAPCKSNAEYFALQEQARRQVQKQEEGKELTKMPAESNPVPKRATNRRSKANEVQSERAA